MIQTVCVREGYDWRDLRRYSKLIDIKSVHDTPSHENMVNRSQFAMYAIQYAHPKNVNF